MPNIVVPGEVPILDLRDSLLIRMQAIELIRECIVRCMENEKWNYLPSTTYLLNIVIEDCRKEISNTFREVKQT